MGCARALSGLLKSKGDPSKGPLFAYAVTRRRIPVGARRRQANQIVLGHLMIDAKSNKIPAETELIEALGLNACVFTPDAETHPQKNVRACGRLGRLSADPGQGQSTKPAPQARARNRRTKANWLGYGQNRGRQPLGTPRIDRVSSQGVVPPYAMGNADQDRVAIGTHRLQTQPRDRSMHANDRGRLLALAPDPIILQSTKCRLYYRLVSSYP
jgi:hypothetical protein